MAPEVLLPLRQVGVQFHNAADGVAAAEGALDILALPAPETGTRHVHQVRVLELRDVSVRAGDRDRMAPAGLSARVRPGRITVLAGPSGSGRTTAMNVALGLIRSEEHTSELQSRFDLVCRLLLEKKKKTERAHDH